MAGPVMAPAEGPMETITYEDFAKLELRVARMAQRTLNVKNRHRSLIVVTNQALSNVTKS